MRKLIMTCAAAVMFAATSSSASAQGAVTQDINLSATVTSYCSIAGTTTGAATAINQALSTTATGSVNTTAIPVNIGTILCNKGADIKLSSLKGALLGPSAASSFQNYINYSATTTGFPTAQAAVAANVTTGTATPTTGTTVSSNNSAFSITGGVTITPTANSSPLVSGSYSDVLTLTVTPQ